MQQLRFNGFLMIHKALRAMLYDAAIAVQQADFTDLNSSSAALAKVEQVLNMFDNHADHEDEEILKLTEKYNEQLAMEFEQEHVTDRKLVGELKDAIAAYKATSDKVGQIKAGNKIFYAFNEFIAFNLYHMNKEESDLLETLWEHFTDEQLMGINMKIVQKVGPEENMKMFSWFLRTCNNTELITALKGGKANMPPPAFNALMKMAEQYLPADRFELVRDEVMEEAFI